MSDLMQSFTNLASVSTEGLILKQMFNIVGEATRNYESLGSFLKNASAGVCGIFGVLILKYLVENKDTIPNILKFICIKLFYKNLMVVSKDNKQLFTLLQKDMNPKSEPKVSYERSNLPIYITLSGETLNLDYCLFIHDKIIDDYITRSFEPVCDFSNKEKKTVLRDANRKYYQPYILYPSYNYRRLDKIINNFFDVVKITGMYKAQGILINGEPGLGKSESCSYLASLNKYGEIIYINMTLVELLKKSFKTIIQESLPVKSSEPTIIYFDEMDKYLDFNLMYSYNSEQGQSQGQSLGQNLGQNLISGSSPKSELKSEPKTDRSETPNSNSNLNLNLRGDYEKYIVSYKTEFLYELLALIETKSFENGVVFIFCSNNFDKIFENIDETHFKSLRDRFANVNFNRCDYTELKGFINYFNEKVKGTDMYYEQEVVDLLTEDINSDISLTYRSIKHYHIAAQYDLKLFIEYVNGSSSDCSPKIKELKESKAEIRGNIKESKKLKERFENDTEIENEIENDILKKDVQSIKSDVHLSSNILNSSGDISEKSLIDVFLRDDIEKLSQLLDEGLNVNTIRNGLSLLMYAIWQNAPKCFEKLIQNGANVNYTTTSTFAYSSKGCSPLIRASTSQIYKFIEILIQNGANVNHQDDNIDTPLFAFLKNYSDINEQRINIIKLFLENGYNIHLKNKYNETILFYLFHKRIEKDELKESYFNLILDLFEKNIDYKCVNKNGDTFLYSFCSSKMPFTDSFVRQILSYCSDIIKINLEKIISRTFVERNFTLTNVLLEYPDVLNFKFKDRNNILMYFISNVYYCSEACNNIIRKIIKLGVDINAQNLIGETALTLAVKRDDKYYVKTLLELGANKHIGLGLEVLMNITQNQKIKDILKD